MNKEELIEGYFSGQLTNEEFSDLKTLLEEDAEFRSEFHHQLEIQQTISQDKSAFLKDRFAALDRKTEAKTKWYQYAATVAILIGVGLGYIFFSGQTDYQDLYTDNFEAYPNVVAPTVRGDSDSDNGDMESAFRYYDSEDYTKAAELFGELYKDTQEDYAYFYEAVSLMAAGQTDKAVSNLEQQQWAAAEKYQTIAEWYVALGYLKLENKEKAIIYLEKVANSAEPIANQAQEILKKLK